MTRETTLAGILSVESKAAMTATLLPAIGQPISGVTEPDIGLGG
jgi:hypothetical protein